MQGSNKDQKQVLYYGITYTFLFPKRKNKATGNKQLYQSKRKAIRENNHLGVTMTGRVEFGM